MVIFTIDDEASSMSKKRTSHTATSKAFIDAARAADADEDEKRWEARLNAVAKAVAPQPVKSARKAMAKSAAKPAKKT